MVKRNAKERGSKRSKGFGRAEFRSRRLVLLRGGKRWISTRQNSRVLDISLALYTWKRTRSSGRYSSQFGANRFGSEETVRKHRSDCGGAGVINRAWQPVILVVTPVLSPERAYCRRQGQLPTGQVPTSLRRRAPRARISHSLGKGPGKILWLLPSMLPFWHSQMFMRS